MNIPLLTIASLAAELHDRLTGQSIWAVDGLGAYGGLRFRVDRKLSSPSLFLSTNPELFVPFVYHGPQLDSTDSPFVQSLQRALTGSRIDSIRQWRYDRILRIDCRRSDEIHGAILRSVMVELVPRRQNIILLDPDRDVVLDALRRVSAEMSRVRNVLPGRPFQPPPAPPGLHPLMHPWADLRSSVRSSGPQPLSLVLSRLLPWASSDFFAEIASRWMVELNRTCDDVPDEELQHLWGQLGRWLERIQRGPEEPTLILDLEGHPSFLLPYCPQSVPHAYRRSFETLSLALQTIYQQAQARWDTDRRRKRLLSQAHISLHRQRRALKHLETDLARAGRADEFQKLGEIITANIGRLKKGISRANLQDPYAQEKKQIEVDLDPKLSPAQNAQRYFQRYRKSRDGQPKIRARLKRVRALVGELEELREMLQTASQRDLFDELEKSLSRLGAPSTPTALRQARYRQQGMESQPRSFALKMGWTVLVGRNNRQNDLLTHRLARPDDLWFHAQGVPGSHVILRREGHKDEPSKEVLEQTASLAAHFSRARHSGTVAVIYTAKRYVRKPKGAEPGVALVEREKTLFVKPRSPRELDEEDEK